MRLARRPVNRRANRTLRPSSSRPPIWGSEDKQVIAVLPFKIFRQRRGQFLRIFAGRRHHRRTRERAFAGGAPVAIHRPICRSKRRSAPGWRRPGDALCPGRQLHQNPDRFRVTAQLIKTATGEILWSEKIDSHARDLITLQDTIAERVIPGLKVKLTKRSRRRERSASRPAPKPMSSTCAGAPVVPIHVAHFETTATSTWRSGCLQHG